MQDLSPSSGPSGPGFNQSPYRSPYPPKPQPHQSYGGSTPDLSRSAPTSPSYSNTTKKQQTGVMGFAKGTVGKIAGKGTKKQVKSACCSYFLHCSIGYYPPPSHSTCQGGRGRRVWVGWGAYFPTPIGSPAISLSSRHESCIFFLSSDPFETPVDVVG